MEAVALKLPDALNEDELVSLPATWEEYLRILDEAAPTVTVQFLDNEIIISQASRAHESLVVVLGSLLLAYFAEKPEYDVLGSNVKIAVPNRKGDFNADVSVVKEPVEYGTTTSGKTDDKRIKNPVIVVEVLSRSTQKFDQDEKLSYYKLISSIQHILFVDQYRPFASVYTRTDIPDEWLNHDYRTLKSIVRLGDVELPMQSIYRKVSFS